MQILYNSTRGIRGFTASQAILQGLSQDGGLFVPEQIPRLERSLRELSEMSYQDIAFEVMKLFLTDFTEEELRNCIRNAYDEKFDTKEIAPLHRTDEKTWFLELYHGATIAFKDMALSILPHLMTTAAAKNGLKKEIVILTATSGDTGKAALAGFADVPGTRIIVFYPKNGVSAIQERQMVTQKGKNTFVIGITGNFDDAQTGVKKMFNDPELREKLDAAGFCFSSANSINIGRLVPQIAYYVYAYVRLLGRGILSDGDKVNFAVPTGNFGNILAAWYASKIGIPVNRLICASNENKVLYDFFNSGTYDRKRPFILTSSPSMDILISSNLERLIYETCGRDPEKCSAFMASLRNDGEYSVTEEMRSGMEDFYGNFCSEEETFETIRKTYTDFGYVIDTHTAVGAGVYEKYVKDTGDTTTTVIASTASPFKFARTVVGAVAGDAEVSVEKTDLELTDLLAEKTGLPLPKAVEEIRTAPVLHDKVVDAVDMPETVCGILGIN